MSIILRLRILRLSILHLPKCILVRCCLYLFIFLSRFLYNCPLLHLFHLLFLGYLLAMLLVELFTSEYVFALDPIFSFEELTDILQVIALHLQSFLDSRTG